MVAGALRRDPGPLSVMMAVRRNGLILLVIAAAWVIAVWEEMSGVALHLHHHYLATGGLPLWLAALILLGAWQVMTAAMMLPSSLPMVRMYTVASRGKDQRMAGIFLFLGSYFAVWSAFGLLAFLGDVQLHHLVNTSSWAYQHQNLIPVAVFALAAIYQFTPLKDACLKACRHPGAFLLRFYRSGARGGLQLGLRHAMFCLGCCWALMLVMFAAGVAHLYWMAVLTLVMVIEKAFPGGRRLVYPIGVAFALLALTALLAPGYLAVL
jgi:predicted metal-binding membrane protein